MSVKTTAAQVQQEALTGLITNFVNQSHPLKYAQEITNSIIFQTDLDLTNAQIRL